MPVHGKCRRTTMSRRPSLYTRKALRRWTDEVAEALPNLTRPQAAGLASWSFGMVLARCCALTTVALFLAKLLGQQVNTVRQRLREFYQEADAKKGPGRQDVDVTACFAPLLRWVLRDWPTRDVPVALDATALGSLFVVLCVSVVYRGCAIPVAWKVLPANVKGAWRRPWLDLLRTFHGRLDGDWKVVVLADRGLYARWLFNAIRKLGWHPMLRINLGGKFRPAYWRRFVPLASLVPHVGGWWRGRGTAALHAVGLLGPGTRRAVVAADGPGPPGQRRCLVRVAQLDRAVLQGLQTRRLAVAADADDGPGASGAAVAGGGGSDAVAGAGGWGPGRGGASGTARVGDVGGTA